MQLSARGDERLHLCCAAGRDHVDDMREDLLTPEAVSKATADYREQMNPVGAFLADCVTREAGVSVTARDLYYVFDDWCCANAIRPWQETAFGKAMEGKGYEKEMKRVR